MIEIDIEKTVRSRHGTLRLRLCEKIRPGERVALFGPSGAGKTTLLRMLAGLTRPDTGRVVVDGETWFDAARGVDLPVRRRSIGVVFQDGALFPHLDVRRNVEFGAAAGERAWVDELLALTGLSPLHARLPGTLSGGQKQRVALARALARKPALLLLDEPLSALDADARRHLQDDLLRLHDRLKFRFIVVSHDIAEVFTLAQRVFEIRDGVVNDAGNPQDAFLSRGGAGRLHLHGKVLAVRHQEVVHVVTLLIGQEVVEVLASEAEVARFRIGDVVAIAVKAAHPLIAVPAPSTPPLPG